MLAITFLIAPAARNESIFIIAKQLEVVVRLRAMDNALIQGESEYHAILKSTIGI
ncbi:hypothetical protein ANO14919_012760 [Xylariales sp. No.14919]|nr:hypothetical protein ANO14919_012760 [Xylariales sp. No.14919]